ncbi:hypothetical protein GCM10010145_24010 [Streptomyces ruber]|uniref:Uncharacterized protein n=2 Tax=Streptomyces TaxID=1883 RepID=A0A918BB35_9ACTN|nr:hypothetical protein GCM10010145_24010 [Streptomyces ruber]
MKKVNRPSPEGKIVSADGRVLRLAPSLGSPVRDHRAVGSTPALDGLTVPLGGFPEAAAPKHRMSGHFPASPAEQRVPAIHAPPALHLDRHAQKEAPTAPRQRARATTLPHGPPGRRAPSMFAGRTRTPPPMIYTSPVGPDG